MAMAHNGVNSEQEMTFLSFLWEKKCMQNTWWVKGNFVIKYTRESHMITRHTES